MTKTAVALASAGSFVRGDHVADMDTCRAALTRTTVGAASGVIVSFADLLTTLDLTRIVGLATGSLLLGHNCGLPDLKTGNNNITDSIGFGSQVRMRGGSR